MQYFRVFITLAPRQPYSSRIYHYLDTAWAHYLAMSKHKARHYLICGRAWGSARVSDLNLNSFPRLTNDKQHRPGPRGAHKQHHFHVSCKMFHKIIKSGAENPKHVLVPPRRPPPLARVPGAERSKSGFRAGFVFCILGSGRSPESLALFLARESSEMCCSMRMLHAACGIPGIRTGMRFSSEECRREERRSDALSQKKDCRLPATSFWQSRKGGLHHVYCTVLMEKVQLCPPSSLGVVPV